MDEQPLAEFPAEVVTRWNAWRAVKVRVLRGEVAREQWEVEASAIATLGPELGNLVEVERHQLTRQLAVRRG